MSTKEKSRTLYATPFSRAYWRDAVAELKDTRMLVIAALLIALRVAMKFVSVPLAPNLRINIGAPLVNAMGAMIFGPVMAGLAACVSDTLGCILFPQGTYFFPYMFVEAAGSVLFAMFFYRAKMTARRVILARFSMDLLVNILLNSVVSFWYYKAVMGKSYAAMVLPAVIKNLCMFPIEAFLLALFLSIVVPLTHRLGLTYDNSAGKESMKFTGKQIATLVVLFAIGAGCVTGYLFYYYDHTSVSAAYSASERYDRNCGMIDIVKDQTDQWDESTLVTTVESAYRKFGKGYTTYSVAVYQVDEQALADSDQTLEGLRGMSKSKAAAAAKDGLMTRVGTVTVVLTDKTGQVQKFLVNGEG